MGIHQERVTFQLKDICLLLFFISLSCITKYVHIQNIYLNPAKKISFFSWTFCLVMNKILLNFQNMTHKFELFLQGIWKGCNPSLPLPIANVSLYCNQWCNYYLVKLLISLNIYESFDFVNFQFQMKMIQVTMRGLLQHNSLREVTMVKHILLYHMCSRFYFMWKSLIGLSYYCHLFCHRRCAQIIIRMAQSCT